MEEKVMTTAAIKRAKRNAAIRDRYNVLLEGGSKPSAIHIALANEFEVSLPTIIRAVKGDPVPRKRRRTRKKVA